MSKLNLGQKEQIIHIRDGEADFEYGDEIYTALYEYFCNDGSMPYGIQKARDGDPDQWIYDRLYNMKESDLHNMLDKL